MWVKCGRGRAEGQGAGGLSMAKCWAVLAAVSAVAAEMLRCLGAVGGGGEVLVVDD